MNSSTCLYKSVNLQELQDNPTGKSINDIKSYEAVYYDEQNDNKPTRSQIDKGLSLEDNFDEKIRTFLSRESGKVNIK